jgi:hypothetical protein
VLSAQQLVSRAWVQEVDSLLEDLILRVFFNLVEQGAKFSVGGSCLELSEGSS